MGFERSHPAINLLYFLCVLTGTIAFQNPFFLGVSYICAFVYSIKRNGRRAVILNLALLPLIVVFALYYSSYTHFGVTVLWKNAAGNNMTLESMVYGLVLGVSAASVCMWLSCLYSVFTTDKVVYLFGCVSPRLSLALAIVMRMVPRMIDEFQHLNRGRSGIGCGAHQGNWAKRMGNGIKIFSMMITWLIEAMSTVSASMTSRGSSLRGRKAFSLYRFDHRDRSYVTGMFLCMTLTAMGWFLGRTDAVYSPRLIFPTPVGMDLLFLMGYLVLCLMPLVLEWVTEYRFDRARRGM